MKTKFLLTCLSVAALGLSHSRAQTLWNSNINGALIETSANWNPSTSNPTSASSVTYQIGGVGSGSGNPTWGTGSINANATVNQQGLTVTAPRSTTTAQILGTWNLNGGSLIYQENSTTNRRLQISSGGTLLVNGGTVGTQVGTNGLRGTIDADGTDAEINLVSGAFVAGTTVQLQNNGTMNLQGGSFSLATLSMSPSSAANSFLTITGGSLSVGTFNHGGGVAGRNGVVTFGAGSGSLSITSYVKNPANGSTIDFLDGTGGSLTISGFTTTNYANLWDTGVLLWDGQNKAALGGIAFAATDFSVSGSTLTLVPEPASAALVLLGTGTLVFLRRRRLQVR